MSVVVFTESDLPKHSTASTSLPVSGVNAHLRLIPRDPENYRVVLTFHHADGSLCEAALGPSEATELMSEIAGVIDQGKHQDSHRD